MVIGVFGVLGELALYHVEALALRPGHELVITLHQQMVGPIVLELLQKIRLVIWVPVLVSKSYKY